MKTNLQCCILTGLFLGFILSNVGLAEENNSTDKVAATVNGEPIYESELLFSSRNFFNFLGSSDNDARKIRLERAIHSKIIGQFLKTNKIEVAETEINDEIEQLRKNPPSAGCACCGYPTLEAFMESNYLEIKDLRRDIANNLGIAKFLDALWERKYPSSKEREELLDKERPRIEKEYVRASHIFFNTYQNPDFRDNPYGVRKEMRAKAYAAWERLQKGDTFENVARQESDDTMSKCKGGLLGCITIDVFGKSFFMVVSELKKGEYSKPLETTLGFHIIRREPMTKNDMLKILKDDFKNQHWDEIESKAVRDAEVKQNKPQ